MIPFRSVDRTSQKSRSPDNVLSRPIERPNELIETRVLEEAKPWRIPQFDAMDTRTLILEAARSRLLADGYGGLSTRKVAEEAGVPLSQFHYYLGSKQGLILALLEEENQRRLARQQPDVRRGRTTVAALRARVRLPRG